MPIDSVTGVRRKFLLSFVVDFKLCLLSVMNVYTPKNQHVWTKISESQITNISLLCTILWNAVFVCGSLALRLVLLVISHEHQQNIPFMCCRNREVLVLVFDTFQ